MVCPVDREVVQMNEVFPDRGISRTIGNLKVRCVNVERGCEWVDDLRELNQHEEQCEYRVKLDHGDLSAQHRDNELILQQILSRLQACEQEVVLKEKEMALLKAALGDLKNDMKSKDRKLVNLNPSMVTCSDKLNH